MKGVASKRAFGEVPVISAKATAGAAKRALSAPTVTVKVCASEEVARELFRKHGIEQYWDLAFAQTVLSASATDEVL